MAAAASLCLDLLFFEDIFHRMKQERTIRECIFCKELSLFSPFGRDEVNNLEHEKTKGM